MMPAGPHEPVLFFQKRNNIIKQDIVFIHDRSPCLGRVIRYFSSDTVKLRFIQDHTRRSRASAIRSPQQELGNQNIMTLGTGTGSYAF